MRRLYEVLGVSEDAAPKEIEYAYKRAASKHHPDKNLGNEAEAAERFKEIKEAYECLIDPERRKTYDETGKVSVQAGSPPEDLLMYILTETVDRMYSAYEILQKTREVLDNLIEESEARVEATDEGMESYQEMLEALRFSGKGVNLVEGVLRDKLEKLREEKSRLTDTINTMKDIYPILDEYEALDRPSPQSEVATGASIRQDAIETLLRQAFGNPRGGMPFSGV